jgi:DNA ligase D-like protein (predicted ligase)
MRSPKPARGISQARVPAHRDGSSAARRRCAKLCFALSCSEQCLKSLPRWIEPQLAGLAERPPSGAGWAHELKYDGYRLHARLEQRRASLLTRNGLDWTDKYPTVAAAVASLPAKSAYIDGELCAFNEDGTTSFAALQAATDEHRSGGLVYVAFDLLYLDGEDLRALPLSERNARLETLLAGAGASIRYGAHYLGDGKKFLEAASRLSVEGIVSKRLDARYVSGDRRAWRKVKLYHREDFVIVGFTNPPRRRALLSSLLLGYYDGKGRLIYAGRGAGSIPEAELQRLHARLVPLIIETSPLASPPPKSARFGAPLKLSEVRWVRPELVCETRFLCWTADGLLRQPLYQGLHDRRARDVRHTPPGRTERSPR